MGLVLSRARVRRAGRALTVAGALLATVVAGLSPAAAAQVQYSSPPIQSWRLNGQGFATVLVGDVAYVGGQFLTATSFDGQTKAGRVDLAAFDVRTGDLVTSFRADTDGIVRALATDGTRLFVGGSFTTIGGVARKNLAALDLTTGEVLTDWQADANKVVWALTVEDGVLYAGGAFNKISGQPRIGLGSVDAATAATSDWAPTVSGQIRSLAVDPVNGFVYAGGRQTTVNGVPSQFLTKLDFAGDVVPVTFSAVRNYGQGLDLNADGTRLAVAGADNHLRYLDTATGSELWREHCEGNGQAAKIIDDTVVAGFHDGCDNVSGRDLMLLDVANGARDPAFLPVLNKFWGVRAVDGDASVLVAAGKMTRVDGQVVGSFAIFPAP
jgi:outer membrane protein assembly factor BamB